MGLFDLSDDDFDLIDTCFGVFGANYVTGVIQSVGTVRRVRKEDDGG
jgi:hypothetical protein